MKKAANKLFSLLLVVVMLFNMFSPTIALALEVIDNNEPLVGESETLKETIPMDRVAEKGNIEVEVHLALPIRNVEKNDVLFTIRDHSSNFAQIDLNVVNEPSDGYYRTSIDLGGQKIAVTATERDKDGLLLSGVNKEENVVYFSINLYDLAKGTYTIELSGKHFVTYQTEVTLADYSQRVMVSDEKGMFEIGDINNDNQVDETDSRLMIDSLGSSNLDYDLNLDGVVDIADLNYITSMLTSSSKSAIIEPTDAILHSDNISFEVKKDALVGESSDLSALFQEEGVVTLKQVGEEPIELGINLSGETATEAVTMSQVNITLGQNAPKKMLLRFETENDGVIEKEVVTGESTSGIHLFTEEEKSGTAIKVDLGKQVAVKKVTIVVTETSENNLADIAEVEFLNNVKVQTKEPENFYTPKNIAVDNSVSEQLTVTFDSVPNVTGYEIQVEGGKMNGTIFQTTYTTFTIEDLDNYTEYTISVQSVNQEWRSGWGVVKATPQATRKPPKVDMVEAVATYSGIDFHWNDMDDTLSYNLYYRKVGDSTWIQVDQEITGTSYSLRGLEGGVEYEAYLTGNNPLGEGDPSQTVLAKTLASSPTITPKYKLINDYNEKLLRTNHIEDVRTTLGSMIGGKYSMIDDDFTTYWSYDNWQVSASAGYDFNSPIFVLDQSYSMDEFVITVPDSYPYTYKPGSYSETSRDKNDTLVYYWSSKDAISSGNKVTVRGVLTQKYDENKHRYYVLKLQDPIDAEAVQFGLTVANNNRSIQIDEVKFYHYDSLVDDVADLFVDDLRVELKDGVTQETIDALKERANTMDHEEYSPYRDSVLADLEYAEKILNDEALNDVIVLNPNISNSYNNHIKFAMTLNDYQPLDIVAKKGDTLNVYVGSTGNVNVQLVYTQYYAEAGTWSKTYNLKKGQNIVEIDGIGSGSSERGGSVYVRYTSTPNASTPIKVRVSGGTKIPTLDVSLLSSEEEKKEAISTYIENLKNYNDGLDQVYKNMGSTFDKKLSVLGSTEIVTEYGLFSVSSVAVMEALNSKAKDLSSQTNILYESTEAFDEMMEMFYRQKGFEKDATEKQNEMPKSRINIRYMRMFDGAFMYAGGYHIGIEYGSIPGLIQAHRNSEDATGYFGWGISHEIGHQINLRDTVFAEVTNNIYALLAQTSNDKDLSRLEGSNIYDSIYTKVTSHTIGRAQNVFVQLGMYWQLHLAYDDQDTFSDTNSVYSKINRIARTYTNSNGYSRDELTILYSCMALEKDLTDFFEIWGLKASEKLKEEIASLGYPKETKAIYYLNDAARRYRIHHGTGISDSVVLTASIQEADSQNKRVTLNFKVNAENEKILGYEILRNGVSIGFVPSTVGTFTDNVGAENNRAYTYQVVAYDYLLNKTNTVTLDEVKITHDGSIAKDKFTITSNVKAVDEVVDNEDENFDYKKLQVNKLIDGNPSTGFKGTEKIKTLIQNNDRPSLSVDNGNAYVILNLNNPMSVSGIKYRALVENGVLDTNTVKKYKISVSTTGEDNSWTVVRTGVFALTEDEPEATIYFMGQNTDSESQLWTYNDVAYIKIESDGNTKGFSGAEIDIIAPPGDNVDFGENAIGVLEEDYCYLDGGCDPESIDENGDPVGIIEKGSVVIQGTYRGNPSFNNVLIADALDEKHPYSGYFLIFAELNSDKSVYEVAEGTWLYVMKQEQYAKMISESSSIRAYLYRVNDAETFDDQRLTSTSRVISDLKDYNSLPKMKLTNKQKNN